jgi:hypothetical protein
MDFTAVVSRKIEERREGRSAAAQAAAKADARFRARADPLLTAVSNMVAILSADPMFGNAIGRNEVTAKRDDKDGTIGVVQCSGRAGVLSFQIIEGGVVLMQILPDWVATSALDCSYTYTHEPIKGDLSAVDDLIGRACDHIADFIADLYLSPAAHMLEPESPKSWR